MDSRGYLIIDVLIMILILTILINTAFPILNSSLVNLKDINHNENCYNLANELYLKLEDNIVNNYNHNFYGVDLNHIIYSMDQNNFKISEEINFNNDYYTLRFQSKVYNEKLLFVDYIIEYDEDIYEEFEFFIKR